MKLFRRPHLALLCLSASVIAILFPNFASSQSKWITRYKLDKAIDRQKNLGNIPVKIQCRNKPGLKVTLKPEFRITWKKNTSGKLWRMQAIEAHPGLAFGPAQTSGDHRYKMISHDDFLFTYSHRKMKYKCAIWHR